MNSHYTLYRHWLSPDFSNNCFQYLKDNIKWHSELKNLNGETIRIKRKMAYVSSGENVYKYANLSFESEKWNEKLELMRNSLNVFAAINGHKPFNSVLLNYYENGKNQIGWHSDKEESLGENPVIACVNLGATRTFWFLEKATGIKTSVLLCNGDLLVMEKDCQKNYMHAILKEPNVTEPRISLTFRHNS